MSLSRNVRLLSSDNDEFVVSKETAEQSVFIENMIVEGETDYAIPLHNVTTMVLKKVIEWCDHHRHDPEETKGQRITEIDEWDQAFFQMDQEMLFDIINAANYLDIKGLLDAGCMTVRNMIKGKTAEEIRNIFKVTSDFTPEEDAQIIKESKEDR